MTAQPAGTPEGAEERVVLIAEDSMVVRALLRSQLKERGYTVIEAADGEQAIQRAREAAPDVILLDVEMPRMDGFEVLRELKRDPVLGDVPVIFITGRTTADDAVSGLNLGAQDYLRKPFEEAELAARVHAAMRTKALQDRLRAVTAELERQTGIDRLTGLPNRRVLDEELERLVSRSARHERPLSILLVDAGDIDDDALTSLTGRLTARLRKEDLLGRWTDRELVVLAPDTGSAGAETLGEALRSVAAPPAAVGVATWRGDDPDNLLRRAAADLRSA